MAIGWALGVATAFRRVVCEGTSKSSGGEGGREGGRIEWAGGCTCGNLSQELVEEGGSGQWLGGFGCKMGVRTAYEAHVVLAGGWW